MPVIDAHAYIGESLYGQTRSADELLREMDRLKIDQTGLCPNKPTGYALPPVNRLVAKMVQSHPDRFFGWVRVDPWQGKAAVDDLKSGIEELGLRGLLLHPFEELFQIAHHLADPLLDYAAEKKFPVMIEAGYHLLSHPLDIAELAHRFPGVTIIATHGLQLDDAGFALTDAELAMKECSNLTMESSGMYAPDIMLNVVNTLGVQRLIFGSHSPWLNLEFELERIQCMNLSAEQKQAVLGGNILKLILPGKEGA
jgi:predicted TIM-barrel fold metal-dependent hydrolase